MSDTPGGHEHDSPATRSAQVEAVRGQNRLRTAVRFVWHYLERTEIDSVLRAGSFARRVWTIGVAERLVIAVLILPAAVGALAAWPRLAPPLGEHLLAWSHLGFMVVAWSVAVAAAAAQPTPLALALISPWLVFYQVLACGIWAGTPVAVIPTAWLAWVFWLKVVRVPSPRRRAWWWLAASAGLGYVGSGPSGLRRWLGCEVWQGQLLLCAILLVAGGAALMLVRKRRWPPLGFAHPLIGGLLTSGAAIAASAWRDWSFTVGWTRTVFLDANGVVILFWLWAAGSFAASSLRLAGWSLRRVVRLAPRGLVVPGLAAAVGVVTLWRALRPTQTAGGVMDGLVFGGDLISTACVIALFAWWGLRRRLTPARATVVFIWWVVTGLVLRALRAGGLAMVTAYDRSGLVGGLGLLAIALGLAAELGKMERDWAHASAERTRVQVGFVAVAVACAVVVATIPEGSWETVRLNMVLAGMLHLGIPLALYEPWRRRSASDRTLGTMPRVTVFALGYLTALFVLAVEPYRATSLLAAGPVLVLVLAVLAHARPHMRPAGGALAGALYGGGLIAGWMMPAPPTIPFIPRPMWVDTLRDWGALGHQPLSTQHLALLALAWALGALVGWLVFLAMRPSTPWRLAWRPPAR
jgi:hypothetical protein